MLHYCLMVHFYTLLRSLFMSQGLAEALKKFVAVSIFCIQTLLVRLSTIIT